MVELEERTKVVYRKAVELLRGTGLCKRSVVMVLFCMIYDPELTYWEALEIWAEVQGHWSPERWHSQLCYALLKRGIEQQPGTYLAALIEREGLHNIENGVSS